MSDSIAEDDYQLSDDDEEPITAQKVLQFDLFASMCQLQMINIYSVHSF